MDEPIVRKDSTIILRECYKTPKTIPLIFHFDPSEHTSKLEKARPQHVSVEGKDIYLFDDCFSSEEEKIMREYSQNAQFSRKIYASLQSQEKKEKPARSMDSREKWQFFSHPPQPIGEIYRFLGRLSDALNAEITTLPWDFVDQTSTASAVVMNLLEELSEESMESGKHHDYTPEKGVSFGIPILYARDKTYFREPFTNGATGKPLLFTALLYGTSENYLSEYGMGTTFYRKDGTLSYLAACKHMRLVLFEGDTLHSIEKSNIPSDTSAWRISYVFKLCMNPKDENQNLKEEMKCRFSSSIQ